MRIGELAGRAGVSVRALRYYEEQNLLTSERSPSGQRHYPESAVERVQLIQQLYAAGLASKSIVGLMPCVVTGEVTPELLERLEAERDRIDAQISGLARTRDKLDGIITLADASARAGRPCPH
ncbi:MerR family transcriptional regulator [Streptomyces sp. NPDC007896]|jgi:DNA-binding transcriptional MerR regulator|uniref:MerR family transcriptional regulator n=1 Tax=Streptomyces TaxID=1883 RepID=UPI00143E3B26|nr:MULTISPECIES: MerR family transcriptional regulator [Streptomyces]QIY74074.1 MerR family transcriptional regulator [Streptomyces sp. RLB1-33]QUW78971.1 MerR family transcriptional regulator [Streptomyces mirabilis]